jgi:ribA/ribD-fused uncharacterized protein
MNQAPMRDSAFVDDVRTRFNAGERMKFLFFWGHKQAQGEVSATCLSQWYDSPFVVDGERFLTAEHFMMAAKAKLFDDLKTRAEVLAAPNPGAAKALGRKVQGFDESTWVQNRFELVCRANEEKFSQNPHLGRFLAQTGERVLVEASPVDRIWGIGLPADDDSAQNPNLWRGLNLLGFALMHVRRQIHA